MTTISTVAEAIGVFAMGIAIFAAVHWLVYTVVDLVRKEPKP